jgi:hypothetical protein
MCVGDFVRASAADLCDSLRENQDSRAFVLGLQKRRRPG